MGANAFKVESTGRTAQEAFDRAVEEAQYDYGHSGYTGTIAEKGSFVMIQVPDGETPYSYAKELVSTGDERINDKWGPAGCIQVPALNEKEKRFLFFGWASS